MIRFLLSPILLVAGALSAQAQDIHVVSAGGGMSTSSAYVLQGTVGSFAPGTLASDVHVVRGGFWAHIHPPAGPIAVPVTVQDEVTTDEDAALTIRPLDNDTDPAGGSLTRFHAAGERHRRRNRSGRAHLYPGSKLQRPGQLLLHGGK